MWDGHGLGSCLPTSDASPDDLPVNPVEVDILPVGDVESRRAVVLEVGAELVHLFHVAVRVFGEEISELVQHYRRKLARSAGCHAALVRGGDEPALLLKLFLLCLHAMRRKVTHPRLHAVDIEFRQSLFVRHRLHFTPLLGHPLRGLAPLGGYAQGAARVLQT